MTLLQTLFVCSVVVLQGQPISGVLQEQQEQNDAIGHRRRILSATEVPYFPEFSGHYDDSTDETNTTEADMYPDYEYIDEHGKGAKQYGKGTKQNDGKGAKNGGTGHGSKNGKGGSKGGGSMKSTKSDKGSKMAKGGTPGGSHKKDPFDMAASGSADEGEPRPPIDISLPGTSPSVSPGGVTAEPTGPNSLPVPVDNFSLGYTITSRQPLQSELDVVTAVTQKYLDEYMSGTFSQSTFTFLDDFITRRQMSAFNSNQGGGSTIIEYTGTGRFDPFSEVFPSKRQLEEAVILAFSGANLRDYEDMLAELPEGNVFRGTQVTFEPDSLSPASSPRVSGIVIAASAVAVTLLAAGVVLYRRRTDDEESLAGQKFGKGDITVAGETFSGDSHDGNGSVDASLIDSGVSRYRDEEGGYSFKTLNTIREGADDPLSEHSPWRSSGMHPSYTENHTLESLQAMALQTPSFGGEESLYYDKDDDGSDFFVDEPLTVDDSHISSTISRRPRTVAEIEDILSQDTEDDEIATGFCESVVDEQQDDGDYFISEASSQQRPRTVEEIERLLSAAVVGDSDAF